MSEFIMGALFMGLLLVGIFFLRFWRDTSDRLFLIFAVAFWLLAITRLALSLTPGASEEHRAYVYLVRLLAFVLILVAIIDKNLEWPARKR
jgi:hypothetical protein